MLADTLRAAITMEALRQAIDQAVATSGSELLTGLIHHSDRGVQYCCDEYVAMLKARDITISMTEDYKPTDNAVAERINGIIKTSAVYPRQRFNSIEHARNVIGRYIYFYNYRRPHMSIGNKPPALAHMEQGEQKKMWKNKIYPQKSVTNE
jgi:putative transposase